MGRENKWPTRSVSKISQDLSNQGSLRGGGVPTLSGPSASPVFPGEGALWEQIPLKWRPPNQSLYQALV